MPAERCSRVHRHPRRGPRVRASCGRGHEAVSEEVHPRADELEEMGVLGLIELMHEEDRRAIEAMSRQLPAVAAAVELIAERLRLGGRLHYFGAGTSGRLA